MIVVLLLLTQQAASLPTVGDTVWVSRTLSVPVGVAVRPRPIGSSAVAEPLGPPDVIRVEGEVRIRYPLVAWQPGRHTIVVPGAILVRPDGWSDTLPDGRATLEIGSVLPDSARDSLVPLPPEAPVERSRSSPLPIGLFVLAAGLVLVPIHWWWGRRGPRVPVAGPQVPVGPTEAMLSAWLSAGEERAALEGWYHRLTEFGSRGHLDAEGAALLERLREARFAPMEGGAAATLCRDAAAWAGRKAA